MHGEFLLVDGQRMAKSLGNGYTLTDIQTKFQIDPIAFRYFCLGAHYRTKLNFTAEAVQAAQTALNKVRTWISLVNKEYSETQRAQGRIVSAAWEAFLETLSQDLNTSEALAQMIGLIQRDSHGQLVSVVEGASVLDVYATLLEMDEVLGLGLRDWQEPEQEIPVEVEALLKERMQARAEKNWAESDRLRVALHAQGWLVEDHQGLPSTVRPLIER